MAVQVFGSQWFAQQQPRLLRVLNHPVLGRPARQALRIGHRDRLSGIGPHWDRVALDVRGRRVPYGPRYEVTYRTTFRTHPKFGKRLYFAGRPLWWLLHGWDLTGRRLIPAWDAGFDTLVVRSDFDPESNTVDGDVRRSGADETWATLIAGAGTAASDDQASGGAWLIIASATTDQWAQLNRSIYLFDTSPLGPGAAISAAVLRIISSAGSLDNLSITPSTDVYGVSPASDTALAASDYGTFGSVSYTGSPISWGSLDITDGNPNDFTFDGTGRSAIAKTGITKLGIRNANYDVAATPPSWSSTQQSQWLVYFADQTGVSQDPTLTTTYTIVTWEPPLIEIGQGPLEVIASGFVPPVTPES